MSPLPLRAVTACPRCPEPGAGCACRPARHRHRSRTGEGVPRALRYLPAAGSLPSRSAVPSLARPVPLRAERRRHRERRDVTARASGPGAGGRRSARWGCGAAAALLGLLPWLCGWRGSAPPAEEAQALRLSPVFSASAFTLRLPL